MGRRGPLAVHHSEESPGHLQSNGTITESAERHTFRRGLGIDSAHTHFQKVDFNCKAGQEDVESHRKRILWSQRDRLVGEAPAARAQGSELDPSTHVINCAWWLTLSVAPTDNSSTGSWE